MHRPDEFDQSPFLEITRASPELAGNPEGAERLAYRFLSKYLRALLRARTGQDREQVWLAFWSYLIARATRRKPFTLSHQAADRLVARFQKTLSEQGYRPRD